MNNFWPFWTEFFPKSKTSCIFLSYFKPCCAKPKQTCFPKFNYNTDEGYLKTRANVSPSEIWLEKFWICYHLSQFKPSLSLSFNTKYHSLTYSLTHPLTHSFTHLLTHSLTNHSPAQPFTHSPTHALTNSSFTHLLTQSLTNSVIRSLTQSLTHNSVYRLDPKLDKFLSNYWPIFATPFVNL